MEYISLLFEFLFLGMGIYLYLLATNRLVGKNAELQKKTNSFLDNNRSWIKIGSLFLMAIMTVNIVLHLMQWQ